MAWLGKVTLGNFSDIAGAVTKLSESVKNIEKNFDSALGFDDKSIAHDEPPASTGERRTLLDPVLAFVGQKDSQKESGTSEIFDATAQSSQEESALSGGMPSQANEGGVVKDDVKSISALDQQSSLTNDSQLSEHDSSAERRQGEAELVQSPFRETKPVPENLEQSLKGLVDENIRINDSEKVMPAIARENDVHSNEQKEEPLDTTDTGDMNSNSNISKQTDVVDHDLAHMESHSTESHAQDSEVGPSFDHDPSLIIGGGELDESAQEHKGLDVSVGAALPSSSDVSEQKLLVAENNLGDVKKVDAEVKMLEAALKGAAHQAKMKADEISRLLMENDNLRSIIEDLKKKSGEAEQEAMREEFQQRLNAAERKVYALTKERDMLRREQNRKDSSILLKEKDEIIKQVMAEGEELSKKQAAQEAQMRKLRAQIRELEEEKQRLKSKLQRNC